MKWVDIHTHLNFLELEPAQAVQEARANGVGGLITIGTCPNDHGTVLSLAEQYPGYVYCTLGVHPHDAKDYDEKCEEFMVAHFADPRVVAVGEIGLDFYYDNSPRDQQEQVFRRQLELSVEHNLPVQIHTRDAEPETISILKEFSGKVRGVIHCFTGTQKLADEALALGLNISASGIVTFKSAKALQEVIRSVPLPRLHVETDAPFLTPVPFRGKKNQPAFVVHTAEKVAELKGVSMEELAQQTGANAQQVFSRAAWSL